MECIWLGISSSFWRRGNCLAKLRWLEKTGYDRMATERDDSMEFWDKQKENICQYLQVKIRREFIIR